MKVIQELLHTGINPEEYSRIPHIIYLDDFNTNHPNPNRIDRIARETDEYLKYKHKNIEM